MKNVDIREFGAVGDGKTMNTVSVQQAIDNCGEAGGGRVTIAGGSYLCGFIQLRSGVELHLDADGVLLASDSPDDFPDIETDFWRTEFAPRFNRRCFIYAEGCKRIAITGRGRINCQGEKYCEKVPPGTVNNIWIFTRSKKDSPARMVFFIGCEDVLIEDVTMVEPAAGWSYWICDCDRVNVDRIRILANLHHPNSDGIHINCSRDVTVSNSFIRCGDDAIICRAYSSVLKEPKPCERVTITNCTLTSYCNAIRIGWYNDGVIRDCNFSNIVITNSNCGIGIVLPSTPETGRGSDQGEEHTLIERISFDNITIDRNYCEPVSIKIEDRCLVQAIQDISFRGIRSVSRLMPCLYGRSDVKLKNISFSDSEFVIKPVEIHLDVPPQRSSNADGALFFSNAENITLQGVRFSL
jgi:polygalacturonase